MLGKILLTTAVILIAFLVVRQRNSKKRPPKPLIEDNNSASALPSADNKRSSDFRLGAIMFLLLIMGLSVSSYYFQWQDDHTILTVRLYSEGQPEAIEYRVYKHQLKQRSFTTLDDVVVTVAGSERMEVEGL